VPESTRNLADLVRRAAGARPDAPALISGTDRVSWAECDTMVDAVAAGLHELRLPPDQAPARVALSLPNLVEFAVAYFAILRAGLVAVPMNPGYTARELRHQLADSAASALVATTAVIDELAEVRAGLPALREVFAVPGPDEVLRGDHVRAFADLSRPAGQIEASTGTDDLAVLLYTSGTTGVPKGAMLSHRALLANHRQLDALTPPVVTPEDVVLLALPLFHAYGLQPGLGGIAWYGACGVLVDRFEPDPTLDLIDSSGVTVVIGVPQMFVAWSAQPDLARRLSRVRLAISGAAPLDPQVAQGFQAATGQPVRQGYGLTEAAPIVTTALGTPASKVQSIGRPIPGVQVRLVGRDRSEIAEVDAQGLVAQPGLDAGFDDDAPGSPGTDPGEIVVHGENLFSGYWPDGQGGPDADGWWPTGDVAYADADGDLFLVDRIGELILVSGFNVYPSEVELVLTGYPGVAEAAVVGVPDPLTGQAVKAYVVLDPAVATDPGAATGPDMVTEADLAAHCARNLARFKCPVAFELVATLPRSIIGKVRKSELEHLDLGGRWTSG
jgi:long-chain acyl-CoA synthetase